MESQQYSAGKDVLRTAESRQTRSGKEIWRNLTGVFGLTGIAAAVIVYTQVSDDSVRQLCGAAALVSALITIRQLMYYPTKTTNNHEHN
jgi:hypothetical protein